MNREFNPTSAPIRTAFAAAAVLATMLVAGSIEGLIEHYAGAAPAAVTAQLDVRG